MLDKRQAMSVEGAEPKRKLAKDLENELGEDYYMNLRQHWDLTKDDEKQDIIPEIYLGKNVADFIDPDIMKVGRIWELLFFSKVENIISINSDMYKTYMYVIELAWRQYWELLVVCVYVFVCLFVCFW